MVTSSLILFIQLSWPQQQGGFSFHFIFNAKQYFLDKLPWGQALLLVVNVQNVKNNYNKYQLLSQDLVPQILCTQWLHKLDWDKSNFDLRTGRNILKLCPDIRACLYYLKYKRIFKMGNYLSKTGWIIKRLDTHWKGTNLGNLGLVW